MNAKWVERDQQPTEMLGTGRGYVAVYKDSDLGVLIPTSYCIVAIPSGMRKVVTHKITVTSSFLFDSWAS